MRKLLFTLVLLIAALQSSAQYSTSQRWNETKEEWYRRMIDFDYNVSDYHVNKPDSNIVGWRTAMIIETLLKNYNQAIFNRKLSQIRNIQMGEPLYRYSVIDKIKLLSIQKQDSVITIKMNTFTKEKKEKIIFDLIFTFINSVSEDDMTNSLFSDIGKYIRKDDYE